MTWENALALVLAVATLAYLVYALLFPEKLG
jgi:K+-transporting ATPase KdpF subunit